MSGLFDKKAVGATHRQTRTQQELKAKKKNRIVTISVLSALILLFVGALLVNSNFVRRTLPAVTIGGVKFSAAEFDYFYNSAFFEYSEWINQQFSDMPDFAASMLPSRDTHHNKQIYDPDTGATWADYFGGQAINQMSSLVQYYNAAKADGFVMSAETRELIDSQVQSLLQEGAYYAMIYPQNFPTAESYLRNLYGGAMNESVLRKVLEFVLTAVSYSEKVRDGFVYSDAELESYYLENRDDLDVFRYRMFLIYAESVSQEDYETDEAYEEAKEAALNEARELAGEIALDIMTEEDFIDAASYYGGETYADVYSTLREHLGESMDENYSSWLRDEAREYGDVTTIDLSYGTNVVFFIERDDNDYLLTAMRQMLFLRDDVDPAEFLDGEADLEYVLAMAEAEEAARVRAEAVYDLFTSGGSTEQKLLELIDEGESDDTTEGGFYEGMARFSYMYKAQSGYVMRVVPEIENWLFADDRQVGDSGLVYTEAYGYHLLYFMGYGEQRFRDLIALDRLREVAFNEWGEGLPAVESKHNWAFIFTNR